MTCQFRNFALFAVFAALLLISATLSRPAFAQTDPDKTLSPYFFVQGDPGVDRLPLKDKEKIGRAHV